MLVEIICISHILITQFGSGPDGGRSNSIDHASYLYRHSVTY